MIYRRKILLIFIFIFVCSVFIRPAQMFYKNNGEIIFTITPEQLQEIQSLLDKVSQSKNYDDSETIQAAQKAIELAIKYYNISMEYVSGRVTYEPYLGRPDGVARPTSDGKAIVRIGPVAFKKSPGWLGSTIFHEAVGHGKQFADGRVYFSESGCNEVAHVEIYQMQIDTKDQFGLTAKEVADLQKDINSYLSFFLNPKYRERVSKKNYTVDTKFNKTKLSFDDTPIYVPIRNQYQKEGVIFLPLKGEVFAVPGGISTHENPTILKHVTVDKGGKRTTVKLTKQQEASLLDGLHRGSFAMFFVRPESPDEFYPINKISFGFTSLLGATVTTYTKVYENGAPVLKPLHKSSEARKIFDDVSISDSSEIYAITFQPADASVDLGGYTLSGISFERLEKCGFVGDYNAKTLPPPSVIAKSLLDSDSVNRDKDQIRASPDGIKSNSNDSSIGLHHLGIGGQVKTQIFVNKGDKIVVSAMGEISFGFFAGKGGPDGIRYGTTYNIVRDAMHGALLVRIVPNPNGRWLVAGSRKEFVAESAGFLEFEVNDTQKEDNSGSFKVTVEVSKPE